MRKILFILLAVLLAACNNNKQEGLFKKIEFKTLEEHKKPNISFEFNGDVELPLNISASIKDSLRNNIVAAVLGSQYIQNSDEDLLKVYADSSFTEYVEMFDEIMGGDPAADEITPIECVTNIYGNATFVSDKVLAYQRNMYTYTGGAHGTTISTNYIFDLNTGSIIDEEQIFKPGYQDKLKSLLIKNIEPLRRDSLLPSEPDEVFSNDLITPNGNVSLNDSSIVYTFNPYEIAPYCYGTIDVQIPKEQIMPLLEANTVVYDYLNK